MRIKHSTGAAASLVHDGTVHEPDEHGFFELPFEFAQHLLRFPFWEAEEPAVYVPEPEPEVEPEPELTPAQKAAITKAANAAAAAEAAEAEAKAAAEAAKPKI